MKRRHFVLGGIQSLAALSLLQFSGCGSSDSMSSLGGGVAQGGAAGINPKVTTEAILDSNSSGLVTAKIDETNAAVTLTQSVPAGGSPIQIVDRGPLQGGLLASPSDAASDGQGNLYVLDASLGLVQVYDSTGNPSGRVGRPGDGDGQFASPSGIAVSSQQRLLFVADQALHRISVFSLDGIFVRRFGSQGDQPGQLNGPRSLALDSSGHLHVGEVGNCRVSVFTPEGALVRTYGGRGKALGQFLSVRAVAALPDGRSLVADSIAGLITVFSSTGVAEDRFAPASPSGKAVYPSNLVVSSNGTVYITVVETSQDA